MAHDLERVAATLTLPKFFPEDSPECARRRAGDILRWCEQEGVGLWFPEAFPVLLREIPDSPPWLFHRGDSAALSAPLPIALVGTRKPSAYGLRAAHAFASGLARSGVVLVSGLARGVDSVAHSAAVLARQPTVAVLGHGLDRIYPRENQLLAREIVGGGGCLVTEYPPGIHARPFHFPQRNRILSGLAYGVLLVEAGRKSGSLITARHALDQNRSVFVVPGPFFEEGFAGSHGLVGQGARLVTGVDAILDELAPGLLPFESTESLGISGKLRGFLRTRGVASLEEIVEVVKEDWDEVRQALESARDQGWAVETMPQFFVYAGK